MTTPYFNTKNNDFTLYQGDCTKILQEFDFKFNLIFADPPYFLSNGGISVHSGKQVSVNKGDWDVSKGLQLDYDFNYQWISLCKGLLEEDGSIWISGTHHNIFSIAQILTEQGFKILNVITWAKTNPPPNLSCRYFTHSTEFIIWARKSKKKGHYFNYPLMKALNGGKQMKDVWTLPTIGKWEKTCGKHPTQKTLPLLSRIILASTKDNDLVLDPFAGSSTTGIASNLFNRRFIGIEQNTEFLELSKNRRLELDVLENRDKYIERILSYISKVPV